MSKPIPKKQRQVKAFAKSDNPTLAKSHLPEKENLIGEKTRSLKLELSTKAGSKGVAKL
jgi:hypothetical protein